MEEVNPRMLPSVERETLAVLQEMSRTLDAINENLERLYDSQMSTFVQVSRIYDVVAATGAGVDKRVVIDILTAHEEGIIDTQAPVLSSFGANTEEEKKDHGDAE